MKPFAFLAALLAAVMGLRAAMADEAGPRAGSGASVPESVLEAEAQGRYWRASRLLEDSLAEVADTAPETILLAARLHAGWGDWASVRALLDGRSWLDGVEGGRGWELLGRARTALAEPEPGAEALRRYLDVARLDPMDRGLAELRLGDALGGADRADAALAAYDRAADLLPWFDDWANYLAAEAAAGAGDVAETDRRLAAAGSVGTGHWRIRVAAALTAGDTMAAREAALAATRTGARDERADAWAELGRLRLAAGDSARARDALGRAMGARSTLGAVTAARLLSDLDPDPEEWRSIARVYEWHGNPSRAVDGYEAYLASDLGTPGERAGIRLRLGRARFDAGRFRQAERGLMELAADSVADSVAAEALYTAGRAQYRQGRGAEGRATFERLAERYPGREAVTRGFYLVADLEHDDLDTEGPDGARAYYRRAADAVPDLNEAGLALMRLAGLDYLEGDYRAAVEIWEEYRTLHPDGRRTGQASYWAARAYRDLGEDSLADARLEQVRAAEPLSFYGMRAAELLGRSILDFPMGQGPPESPAVDSTVEASLRRVDLLAALDRRDDLVQEVDRLRRRAQADTGADALAREYALAEALNQRGYTLTGIGMGWELWEEAGQWNPRLLRIVYPFPFRTMVVPEAEERELDPYLVAALIRRESAFNPVVVSGAGAVGLMQIVPATGRQLARAAGVRDFEPDLLKQPEVNVHLGTRFFDGLQDRYHSLPLVLSAYNAGPTRANVWRRLPEVKDPELFTERVPYRETRDYIRNVLVHRVLYRALYPGLEPGEDGG